MKYPLVFLFTLFLMVRIALADEPVSFSTQWIPDKPQMMTYSSKDKYGDQLYQVSIYKKDDNFEIYINIISNGFTKTVSGTFTSTMYPLQ